MARQTGSGARIARPHRGQGGRALVTMLLLALAALMGQKAAALNGPAAQADVSLRYDVPAGPLVVVLQQIASQAGVLLYFDPSLTRNLNSDGLTGRLLSAVWDPWETLADRREDIDGSDVYTLRRIVPKDRGFSWGDR